MGRFSTTVQIKSNTGREQFTGSFCEMMKKRGLVTCSEDEALVSYALVFLGEWVTVTCDTYKENQKQAQDDVKQFAADMKTSAFSIDVIDSDWAIINLLVGTETQDTVIVGHSEFPDEPPKGNPECWKPLIILGKSWEDLSQIWSKDETFVEDTLCEAAEVLGINPQYMVFDFEELESEAERNQDVALLCFKKDERKSTSRSESKPLTLNAAFKQVFGEALEPLGFVKAKTKYPYYVRVLNGEIVQVVSVKKEFGDTFDILSGMASIYRKKIDLSKSVSFNTGWLNTIANYYSDIKKCCDDYNDNYRRGVMFFKFGCFDNSGKLNIFRYALEQFEKWVLPSFDENRTIEDMFENFHKGYFGTASKTLYDDYENARISNEDESLTLLCLDNPGEMIETMFRNRTNRIDCERNYDRKKHTELYFETQYRNNSSIYQSQREVLNRIMSSEEIHRDVIDELKKRKRGNIERLRSYGLDI